MGCGVRYVLIEFGFDSGEFLTELEALLVTDGWFVK